MSWGLVVAGSAAALSAYSGSQAAAGQAKAAGKAAAAENNAIAKSNLNLIVRNSYKASLMNMQLGHAKKQAIQQGFDTTVAARQATGAASANQAAAGTVGASTDAVLSDIQMKLGEAKAQQEDAFDIMLTNYNNELDGLKMTMDQDILAPRKYEYSGPSSGQIWGGALLQAGLSFAGNYAMRSMQLGLGSKPNIPSPAGDAYGSNVVSSFNRMLG